MPVKTAEFAILAVLCDGELHSNGIMQAVYRKTSGGLILRSTSMLGVLRGLANKGLIEVVKKPHERSGGTGQRDYYKITPLGRQVVQVEADERAKGR